MTTVDSVNAPRYAPTPNEDERPGSNACTDDQDTTTVGYQYSEKAIVYKEQNPSIKGISMDWTTDLGPTGKKAKFKKGLAVGLGWKSAPFIFVAEFGERLGAYGLLINLFTYLLFKMNLATAPAANMVTNFFGATCLTPLIGAILADAYFGRYLVTAAGTIIYTVGLLIITYAAIDDRLRPTPCTQLERSTGKCEQPNSMQMAVLYLSLFVQCIGSGAIRPCTAPFGADQFEEGNPNHTKQILHFFNWYYSVVGFSILLSYTLVVYIEVQFGFGYGFGFCAVVMGLGTFVFMAGTPIYKRLPPGGTACTSLIQVMTAATRKRRLSLNQSSVLYEGASDKRALKVMEDEKILHTENFRFLDRGAIIDDKDHLTMEAKGKFNPWRLRSVHQVEELKILIRMTPVWASAVVMALVLVQSGTFAILQAITMDKRVHIGSLHMEIPAPSMAAFSMLALVVFLPFYDLIIIPSLRRFTGQPKGLTYLQRIGVGLFLSTFAMLAGALVEKKRRDYAITHGHVNQNPGEYMEFSAFWLVPQHAIVGIADSLMIVGQLEFFYEEAPNSIRSMSNAFLGAALGVGSFASSILVSSIQAATKTDTYDGWLQDNINVGSLDKFYWFLSILCGVNFLIFLGIAHWYVYKNTDEMVGEKKDIELQKEQNFH